jgi:hypothetical protein
MPSYEELDGRSIRLYGLPDFNANDADFRITAIEGIFSTPPLDPQFSSGATPGAIASGPWLAKERPLTVVGFIQASREALAGYARAIANSCPISRESTIEILGNGYDIDLKAFVRRYDKADMPISSRLDFNLPLMMLDPYLYGRDVLEGGVSVNSGTFWYESYVNSSGWKKTHVKSGSDWYNTYTNLQPVQPYPDSVSLTPPAGGTTSRRLTFKVVGPLTAGSWQLSQDNEREMWVQVSIPSGQELVIDTFEEKVTMNGEDITNLLYGDMLTLEPGGSTFQLNSSIVSSEAYAYVTALPAYEI